MPKQLLLPTTVLLAICAILCNSTPGADDPPAPESALDTATRLVAAGDTEEAFKLLEKCISANRGNHLQHKAVLKMVSLASGARQNIVCFLNHAPNAMQMVNDSDRGYLYFHMGTRFSLMKDYAASDAILKKGLGEVTDQRWTWSMRYQLCYNRYLQGKYGEAADELKKLEQQGTSRPEQVCVLGIQLLASLYEAKRWQEVIDEGETYMPLLSNDSRKLIALSQVAASYRTVKDYRGAIRLYSEYIQLYDVLNPDGGDSSKRKYILLLIEHMRSQSAEAQTRMEDTLDAELASFMEHAHTTAESAGVAHPVEPSSSFNLPAAQAETADEKPETVPHQNARSNVLRILLLTALSMCLLGTFLVFYRRRRNAMHRG